MPDLTDTIDVHLDGLNETDPALRTQKLMQVWAIDGRLIDPPLAGSGLSEINEMIGTLQAQFAGHSFRRSSAIDAHHEHFRYSWEFVAPDGSIALSGLDVGEVAGDGSIVRITGFFGDLPPCRCLTVPFEFRKEFVQCPTSRPKIRPVCNSMVRGASLTSIYTGAGPVSSTSYVRNDPKVWLEQWLAADGVYLPAIDPVAIRPTLAATVAMPTEIRSNSVVES